jgi:hypothetical protein
MQKSLGHQRFVSRVRAVQTLSGAAVMGMSSWILTERNSTDFGMNANSTNLGEANEDISPGRASILKSEIEAIVDSRE